MKLRFAALLMFLTVPALAAAPEAMSQARQVVADTGGVGPLIRASANANNPLLALIKSPELYRRIYGEELAAHPEWITQADERYAAFLADALTPDDLRVWISYEESPSGRTINEKKKTAIEAGAAYQLTPDEKAAEAAFYNGPQGNAINVKIAVAQDRMLKTMNPMMIQILETAMDRYCQQGGDCSNIKISHPGGVPKP
jgi:hypothetical protein